MSLAFSQLHLTSLIIGAAIGFGIALFAGRTLKLLFGLAIGLVVIYLLWATFFSGQAHAADLRVGDSTNNNLTIPQNQTIDDNLIVTGKNIQIDGKVTGDLVMVGSTLTVNGEVNGDIFALGSTINLAGSAGNNAVLIGSTINIAGQTKRDLGVAGSSIYLTDKAKIGHDVFLVSGSATDTSHALIGGKTYTKITKTKTVVSLGQLLAQLLTLLTTGLVFIWLFPKSMGSAVTLAQKHWGSALLIGLLALLLTPIAAVVLIALQVTLPLGLILFGTYFIALYTSKIVVGLLLGQLMFKDWSKPKMLIIGILVVFILCSIGSLLRLTQLMGLQAFISFAVLLLGLGAIVLDKQQVYKKFKSNL